MLFVLICLCKSLCYLHVWPWLCSPSSSNLLFSFLFVVLSLTSTVGCQTGSFNFVHLSQLLTSRKRHFKVANSLALFNSFSRIYYISLFTNSLLWSRRIVKVVTFITTGCIPLKLFRWGNSCTQYNYRVKLLSFFITSTSPKAKLLGVPRTPAIV